MNTLSLPVLSACRLAAHAVLRGAVVAVVGMGCALGVGAAPALSPPQAVSAGQLYSCPGHLFTNDIHPLQARALGCTLAQQGRWSQAQAPALPQLAAAPAPNALTTPAALPTGTVANTPQSPTSTPEPTPLSVSLGPSGGPGSLGVLGPFGAAGGLTTPAPGAMPVAAPEVINRPLAAAPVAALASGRSSTAPSLTPPLALRPVASPTRSTTARAISTPHSSAQAASAEAGGDAQRQRQRQRDRHAREIVLAELASTQARIQSLSARPQVSADHDNALQRLRRDEDALRRELARRPG